MTNGDRFRKMSDEELARVIIDYNITDVFCLSDCGMGDDCDCRHDKECCMRWLKQEVSHENT